jgi:hypothetical protein
MSTVLAELKHKAATLPYSHESRVAGLGRQFSVEVQRIISLIREYPDAGAPVRLPVRRTPVDRFPCAMVYRRDQESVLILAVAHLRQRPGYWRSRHSARSRLARG